MGRALKIQKFGVNNGITINANGTINQPALSTPVDIGYPSFNTLTNPVYDAPDTLEPTDFLGVVGGSPTISSPSTSYPEISPTVNISLADGSSTGAGAGRIVRQKGAHKFLVTYSSTTSDGSFVVGQAYMIISVGDTTWSSYGAPSNAAAGDIFTATSVGGSGTGTACPVGICVLANTGSPAAGYMSVGFSVSGDSTLKYASYLSNKWIRDWNGMTYGNYSNSNTGTNTYSGENFYPSNFFTDEGTVTWSGAEVVGGAQVQNGTLQLAQIASVTS